MVYGPSTTAAVTALQEKWQLPATGDVDGTTWTTIRSAAGSVGTVPAACVRATAICVDITARLVRLVRNGRIVASGDARFGAAADATAVGVFSVQSKDARHVSTAYHTPMPYSLFFYRAQAIHYSPMFARDGYNGASHGCINLRDRAFAQRLFAVSPLGTPVVVYRSA